MKRVVVSDFHGVIYDPERGEVNPEVLNIIKSLYKQNIPLYIFTNSSLKSLERNDKQKPFLKYFENVFHEHSKPHPESFENLFDTLKCDPSEIMLVDDDSSVVKQAKEYKIVSVKYTNASELKNKLEEILNIDI